MRPPALEQPRLIMAGAAQPSTEYNERIWREAATVWWAPGPSLSLAWVTFSPRPEVSLARLGNQAEGEVRVTSLGER